MDHPKHPPLLSIDPSSASSCEEWREWRKTFENYLENEACSLPPKTRQDKLKILTHSVSCHAFQYIKRSETYESAITTLENLYCKVLGEVFSRHLLISAKQESGETTDDFLLKLQTFADECNFRSVTSEENKKDMIRDAFINGLASPHTRQYLLQNRELSLEMAVLKAKALDLDQAFSENKQQFQFFFTKTSSQSTMSPGLPRKTMVDLKVGSSVVSTDSFKLYTYVSCLTLQKY